MIGELYSKGLLQISKILFQNNLHFDGGDKKNCATVSQKCLDFKMRIYEI